MDVKAIITERINACNFSSQQLWLPFNLFLLLVMFLLNPFGLRDYTDDYTHQFISRIIAPFYPQEKQKKITVVQVDDNAIRTMGETYPLSHGTWGRLIQTIAEYRPKAIFVDILFTQNRDTEAMASLARVLKKYGNEQGDSPVYIADYVVDGESQLVPELQEGTLKARVNWDYYDDSYPLVITGDVSTDATPAWQLYKSYCRTEDCDMSAEAMFSAQPEPMTLYWGSRIDPEMKAVVGNRPECYRNENPMGEVWRLLSVDMKYGLSSSRQYYRQSRQPCVYTRKIYAHQLVQSEEEKRRTVQAFLTDRVVILGATIRGIPDYIYSPVHGLVPGMYWHAMAVDNLITLGENYWQEPAEIWSGMRLNSVDLIEIGLTIIVLVFSMWLRNKDYLNVYWKKALALLFIAGFSLLISFLLTAVFNYTPVNVLGILMLVTLAFATMRTSEQQEQKQ